MMEQQTGRSANGLLSGYRALDLTNEIGFACGKILATLGVDTIKIERPGGDPARNIPPYVGDVPGEERSLYWWAFNTDKRSITLDIESSLGQDIFRRLVGKSDFVIESFTPGYLDSLGIGYEALSRVNPRIIVTSITPFGQKGPYSRYKGSELIVSAMSGVLATNGDPDRPPVREGPDSICLEASAAAALGTIVAHHYRQLTGEGQQVDVSMQHTAANRNSVHIPVWEFDRRLLNRNGPMRRTGAKFTRWIWPCKDGYVFWTMMASAVGAPANRALSKWMDDRGMSNPLREIECWETLDMAKVPDETVDAMHAAIGQFFLTLTKKEIAEEGMRRGINASVVNDPSDVFENPQLRARDYWEDLAHPEFGVTVKYPGYFFLSTETENRVRRRAPRVGEHNDEVYQVELGLSSEEVFALKAANVI